MAVNKEKGTLMLLWKFVRLINARAHRTQCEGSREGFACIAATIDMESFLKISS